MFNLYEDAGNRVIRSLRRRIVWTGQYQLPDSVLLVAAACGRGSGIFQPVCLVFAFTRRTMRLFYFPFRCVPLYILSIQQGGSLRAYS